MSYEGKNVGLRLGFSSLRFCRLAQGRRIRREWKLWPRGLAMAEVLWSYPDPAKRDFAEFSVRAAEHRRRLIREHVNCAPLK